MYFIVYCLFSFKHDYFLVIILTNILLFTYTLIRYMLYVCDVCEVDPQVCVSMS